MPTAPAAANGTVTPDTGTHDPAGSNGDGTEIHPTGEGPSARPAVPTAAPSEEEIIATAPDGIRELLQDRAIREAYLFSRRFPLKQGVDYGWVLALAKDQHARFLKTFDDLDAKAGSLIGYFSGGAGALAVGLFAALRTEKIDSVIVGVLSLIPFMTALAAVAVAVWVRQLAGIYHPSPLLATKYANQCGKYAEHAFAGEWVCAAMMTNSSIRRKARLLRCSTCLAIATIFLLLAPVVASLATSPPKPAESPPSIPRSDP